MINVAIIGAGPYGLSVAAHLKHRGISFRIFGRLMDSWLNHMPTGMMLKSDGFASNIYDPESEFTLSRFCAEQGIAYADTGVPVRLETFSAYGRAFQERMVPELEDRMVSAVELVPEGYRLLLENGESVIAAKVVLAVGITHFAHVPPSLKCLPPDLLSHSYAHRDLEPLRGRTVVVLGGGSSALDLAGLLHETGADVTLVARAKTLKFHNAPTGKPRSLWQSMRHPSSGLGPGMRSRFFSDFPGVFYYFPQALRVAAVKRTLGPSGGWFIKEKVVGRLPTLLGYSVAQAGVRSGRAWLQLRAEDGAEREIQADSIIAATGYKVDLGRLTFLSPQIRASVNTLEGSPILKPTFESSVRGLYFVGVAAAYSFGPVMRFAFGAGYSAQTVTQALTRAISRTPVVEQPAAVVGSSK